MTLFVAAAAAALAAAGPDALVPFRAVAGAAASEVQVAFVIDFGGSAHASVGCVKVPAGDNGYQALAAFTAQEHEQAPTYNTSGLLCSINDIPSSGCGQEVSDGYIYWSYWEVASGKWKYADAGAFGAVTTGEIRGVALPRPWQGESERPTSHHVRRLRRHLLVEQLADHHDDHDDHDTDHVGGYVDDHHGAIDGPFARHRSSGEQPGEVARIRAHLDVVEWEGGLEHQRRGRPFDQDLRSADQSTGVEIRYRGIGLDVQQPVGGKPRPGVECRRRRRPIGGRRQCRATDHRHPVHPGAAVGGRHPLASAPRFTVNLRASAPGRRGLHPAAWWLWAGCLAAAAIRVTNPLLLALIAATAAYVVSARRSSAPWSRSLVFFLRLGLVVIVVRVAVQIVFGQRLPGHVLFTLPEVPLPAWAAGVSIGGPVTAEAILSAAVQGLRLAVVLICFGAANSLASPYRLLRCLPPSSTRPGWPSPCRCPSPPRWSSPSPPSAMPAGCGADPPGGSPVSGAWPSRSSRVPSTVPCSWPPPWTPAATAAGCRWPGPPGGWPVVPPPAACSPSWWGSTGRWISGSLPAGGVPFLAVGAILVGTGLAVGGRRTNRTRYRPDAWGTPEWLVVGSGVVVLGGFVVASVVGVAGLQLVVYPLRFPTLPLLPTACILVGLLPAVVAPAPRALGGARPMVAAVGSRSTAPGRPEGSPA